MGDWPRVLGHCAAAAVVRAAVDQGHRGIPRVVVLGPLLGDPKARPSFAAARERTRTTTSTVPPEPTTHNLLDTGGDQARVRAGRGRLLRADPVVQVGCPTRTRPPIVAMSRGGAVAPGRAARLRNPTQRPGQACPPPNCVIRTMCPRSDRRRVGSVAKQLKRGRARGRKGGLAAFNRVPGVVDDRDGCRNRGAAVTNTCSVQRACLRWFERCADAHPAGVAPDARGERAGSRTRIDKEVNDAQRTAWYRQTG